MGTQDGRYFFLKREHNMHNLLPTVILFFQTMIKVKSRSRDARDITELTRPPPRQMSSNKDNRLLRTVEYRNSSNQYIPLPHLYDNAFNLKTREISSSKNPRKELKQEIGLHAFRNLGLEHRESKKYVSTKTFIGSKLKKKLQKYLLFLTLVNYSLRVSYERCQLKRYKVFVGKGNNSKLVKTIFSNRFWWALTDNESEANLIWTQKSKKKVFANILDCEKDKLKFQNMSNPVISRRRIRVKKRDNKRIYFDQDLQSVLTEKDKFYIKSQCKKENLLDDLKSILKRFKPEKRRSIRVTHNHIENHRLLTNKKNLFYNLKTYCEENNDNVFNYVPLTFHIKGEEEEFKDIIAYEESVESRKEKEKLLWIVKPGENSNRGCGIQVYKKVEQVKKHIEKEKGKHPERTYIVQKYISPFLFHRRKFDIRCFVLVTATPLITAYFYPTGYIRTSSYEFSHKNCTNKYIHLTNDAVQKKGAEYSKYENGNKVRYQQFQKYLDLFHADKNTNFFNDILPVMKELVLISIRSAKNFDQSSKEHTFQILGYDFMIDQNMEPWLIEINTNPCLETECQILQDIVPTMVENAVKIAVDSVFKPPKMEDWSFNDLLTCSCQLLEGNKFELIYSQLHSQP